MVRAKQAIKAAISRKICVYEFYMRTELHYLNTSHAHKYEQDS